MLGKSRYYKKFIIAFLGLIFCFIYHVAIINAQKKSQAYSESILLNKARPSVYLDFLRIVKQESLFEGESDERIWLKIHNNSRWQISFCYFDIDKKYGDIGLKYEVKKYQKVAVEGQSNSTNKINDETRTNKKEREIPQGYNWGHNCEIYNLPSGKSITFSIPKVHLDSDLYIEVEFWYEWENRGKNNELGTYPSNFVMFSCSRCLK